MWEDFSIFSRFRSFWFYLLTRNSIVRKICFCSMMDCGIDVKLHSVHFVIIAYFSHECKRISNCFSFWNNFGWCSPIKTFLNTISHRVTIASPTHNECVITNLILEVTTILVRIDYYYFVIYSIFNNFQNGFRLRISHIRKMKLYHCPYSGLSSKSSFCHFDWNFFVQFKVTNGLSSKVYKKVDNEKLIANKCDSIFLSEKKKHEL